MAVMKRPADSFYECANFFDADFFLEPSPESGVFFTVRGLDQRNSYWHVAMGDASAFRQFLLDNPHVAEVGALAYPDLPPGLKHRLGLSTEFE